MRHAGLAAVLDVLGTAAAPMTATEVANAAGLDVLSVCATLTNMVVARQLWEMPGRKPRRYLLPDRVLLAGLPNPGTRPAPGAHVVFGLICGGLAA